MTEIKLIIPKSVPMSEVSVKFLQGMVNRMAQGFFKYGGISKNPPTKVNRLRSMEMRVKKYQETSNMEWLIDAANFLMIEFISPSLPKAHFRATSAEESPGVSVSKKP